MPWNIISTVSPGESWVRSADLTFPGNRPFLGLRVTNTQSRPIYVDFAVYSQFQTAYETWGEMLRFDTGDRVYFQRDVLGWSNVRVFNLAARVRGNPKYVPTIALERWT